MSDTPPLRVRFAPSPTGHLHVGGARTALFNYLIARKLGGTFIFRIEDTDTARNVAGAEEQIMADLRWLGLEWDEGVGATGDNGPYFQSQRSDLYNAAVQQLIAENKAYYAFDTPEELDAMREQARAEKRTFLYPRPERFPSADDVDQARKAGRPVVVRFAMPNEAVTVHDEVLGDVTIGADELEDFIIQKGDGVPTYHLANVVDDAGMGVTLVMRGQEFLGQTPKHVALQRALGYDTPRYAHLPLIMDMKGRKLSKRDGDVEVDAFRRAGYLPEVLINFLALLGWNPGDDRERMTLDELIQAFTIDRINKANAKFDREKLLAFNTDTLRTAPSDRLVNAMADYLKANPDAPMAAAKPDANLLGELIEMNRGARTFADIEMKCRFLFIADDDVEYDQAAMSKVLEKKDGEGFAVLESMLPTLEAIEDWTPEQIDQRLAQFCEKNSFGLKSVAQPLRVALTGATVSPPIGHTLALIGRERTMSRIQRLLSNRR